MSTRITSFLFILTASSAALADDTAPSTVEFTLDGNLLRDPKNPSLSNLVEGDTLLVRVDANRLFPHEVLLGALGDDEKNLRPETLGVYVVGPSGPGNSVAFEPITAGATCATPPQNPPPPDGLTCEPDHDWNVGHSLVGYRCISMQPRPVSELFNAKKTWKLVQYVSGTPTCLATYDFVLGHKIKGVQFQTVEGTNAPKNVASTQSDMVWSAPVPLTKDTRSIVVTITTDDDKTYITTVPVQPQVRDTHSLVRAQTELIATNRLRTLSFSIAVSAVSREYFTKGPYHCSCVVGCLFVPVAVANLTSSPNTVLQLGAGIGVNLAAGFQVNGGFLAGSSDVNTSWRWRQSWFIGIAIDPVVLADVVSGSAKK